MSVVQQKKVVTSFIQHQGMILLLRRSEKVGSYKGKWAGVSGYLEATSPLEQALKEINEEIGLNELQVDLVNSGEPLEVLDKQLNICWVVYPFLFDTAVPEKISLDWEHVEMQWVKPKEFRHIATVPKLAEAYERCLLNHER